MPAMDKLSIHLPQTGESYFCSPDESLLQGMLRLGRKGIPVGCTGGGCGVCKVRVVRGAVRPLGPISRAHVSPEEERDGYTLACRAGPACAVELEVAGRFEKPFRNGYRTQGRPSPPPPTNTTET
ncbi:MAG: 2Fe-2S iron-sulfur cluster binding domain-containing protein [Alcaligenaceae bacterium]|nr:2Fe-2S iron-sulfur cluster binding domain-containing protein [Alcaligenaceae bacterium SAGV5]MPS50883.1 2Fe-2S iron-sulfur cluster binding domain-containing protein [Alcaligenaceae bacterium SAGV3]MPT59567.1 2Fe-2S iron-sulfur cluster binding domain-containing protein [Alcaligenaceae bacterium]